MKSTFDFHCPRWPLTAALVWIATKSEYLVSRLALDDIQGAECSRSIHMALRHLEFDDTSFITPDLSGSISVTDAWPILAEAFASGKIKAFGNRSCRTPSVDGPEQTSIGLLFPPAESPGCSIFLKPRAETLNGAKQTVLIPNETPFASSYVVWSALSLSREDVLQLWPTNSLAPAPNNPPQTSSGASTFNDIGSNNNESNVALRRVSEAINPSAAIHAGELTEAPRVKGRGSPKLDAVVSWLLEKYPEPPVSYRRKAIRADFKKETGEDVGRGTIDNAIKELRRGSHAKSPK